MFFEFALIGTTASGKSALASILAQEFQALILSLDSLCVYKQINIASAKPCDTTLNEYFGLNLLSIEEHFNVALFFEEYQKAKNKAQALQKPLIIVGGTSFYLQILMQGLSQKVKASQSKLGNDEIFKLIQKIDKEAKINKNDTYRLRKWLSIYEYSKELPSVFLKKTLKAPLIKELKIFELVCEKELLRTKIEQRTKTMLDLGLIQEAEFLFANYDNNLKALNCIGLKECKDFLNAKINKNELENLISTHTAQLAKRQRTFNKKFNSKKLQPQQALNELRTFMAKLH